MTRAIVAACACLASWAALAADPCGDLRFVDATAESGIDFVHVSGARGEKHLPETMGAGLAWLDYDGDGKLDLYVVQSGAFPPGSGPAPSNRLYRNRGGGVFEDRTDASGAGDAGYGQGVVAADYDGDGHVDLYVCNYGPDVLLRNRGDGSFDNTTADAGLGLGGWSSSAAFADADADGDLDLYVTRYVEYDPGQDVFCGDPSSGERRYCDPSLFRGAGDRFYLNGGDGTFRDATAEAGVAGSDGKGLGVLFTDLDGDLRPDLYVSCDLTINLLHHNVGGGRFETVSLLSGAGLNADGKAEAGMGLAQGDVDGDGDPDLLVTNFDVETNTYYRNDGGMQFEDVSAASGFGPPSFNLLGFGLVLADFDLDGALDAYVANGHIFQRPGRPEVTHAQRDLLLLGDGAGRFAEARCGDPLERTGVGRALAAADYDDDGDLDLAIAHSEGPLRLLRNELPPAAWIGLELTGRAPNTEAVGARVTLGAGGGTRVRWVTAGDSYQSTADKRLLFAMPRGASAEVEVVWPSGDTTSRSGLEPGHYHRIVEGESTAAGSESATPLPARGLVIAGFVAAAVAILVVLVRRSVGRRA